MSSKLLFFQNSLFWFLKIMDLNNNKYKLPLSERLFKKEELKCKEYRVYENKLSLKQIKIKNSVYF